MKVIRGRRAVVTGAASGIGRAIALALAREGAGLYLIDIDEAGLAAAAEAARGHGVEAVIDVRDLADLEQVAAAADAIAAHWDGLEILVNCAGAAHRGPTGAMSGDAFERMMRINLLAPVLLTRRLLPTLLAQPQGHIVNVSSIYGLVGTRKATAYQTGKFGLVGFSRALRAEYANAGLGVTALCPGFVRTPLLAQLNLRPEQAGAVSTWFSTDPERVAAKALAAIRRDRGVVVVTALARFLWWVDRVSPSFMDWLNREGWRRAAKER